MYQNIPTAPQPYAPSPYPQPPAPKPPFYKNWLLWLGIVAVLVVGIVLVLVSYVGADSRRQDVQKEFDSYKSQVAATVTAVAGKAQGDQDAAVAKAKSDALATATAGAQQARAQGEQDGFNKAVATATAQAQAQRQAATATAVAVPTATPAPTATPVPPTATPAPTTVAARTPSPEVVLAESLLKSKGWKTWWSSDDHYNATLFGSYTDTVRGNASYKMEVKDGRGVSGEVNFNIYTAAKDNDYSENIGGATGILYAAVLPDQDLNVVATLFNETAANFQASRTLGGKTVTVKILDVNGGHTLFKIS
ncbi:MAG TPA: hypothetical protein VH186_02610 [Chloroflexia bacterium]|nr:hypothetical protein [Chloroflexia bacterium]